jgi:hypothetical protein
MDQRLRLRAGQALRAGRSVAAVTLTTGAVLSCVFLAGVFVGTLL